MRCLRKMLFSRPLPMATILALTGLLVPTSLVLADDIVDHPDKLKFEELENRIERMEAEADLVNFGKKPELAEALESLEVDDEIEAELQILKSSLRRQEAGDEPPMTT